jgi:cellulose biosynthesis protein BcsQ
MPRVISFINMKGGVGKTTLTVNVAHALASVHSKKVLLVDADPQFNASTYLMTDDEYLKHTQDKSKKTLLDVFLPRRHESISTKEECQKTFPEPDVVHFQCVLKCRRSPRSNSLDARPNGNPHVGARY